MVSVMDRSLEGELKALWVMSFGMLFIVIVIIIGYCTMRFERPHRLCQA